MLCRWIRDDLTAHADGELGGWRAVLVRRHLTSCAACGREASAIEGSVARQRHVLLGLVQRPVEADDLWRQVRRRMDGAEAADAVARERRWMPTKRFVLAAAATCVVAGVLLTRSLDPWLIVVGLERPPKAVAEKPELFVDYPLFEHLEAIEHLDKPEPRGGSEESGRRQG